MKLSKEVKDKIENILDSSYFKNSLYVDANGKELDKDKRDKLGQFYTPAKICIRMVEKFNFDTLSGKTILDPTVGSGNLLIACLIAGADIDKLYGNEYDEEVIPTCRNRIREAFKILNGRYPTNEEFRYWQIHQGNALQVRCLTDFSEEYITGGTSGCHYQAKYIDDLKYAQSDKSWRWENEQAAKRNAKPINLWSL